MKALLALLSMTLVIAGFSMSLGAQDLPEAEASGLRVMTLSGAGAGERIEDGKIGPAIRFVLAEFRSQGITRANAQAKGAAALSGPLVRVNDEGAIQVYLRMAATGAGELAALRRYETQIQIVNADLRIVQALVPFDRIEDLAALPFVERITRPSYARTQAGSVTTQGDAILKADQLRNILGVDGTGVKVGVISGGAISIAASQSSGDLPGGIITAFGTCDFDLWGAVGCDEGTAMMEIVHDLAPGATLGFGAIATSLDFIRRVGDLVNTFGANVVVDDIWFPDEPYFEDGPVADAVAAVTDQVVYASSAGNLAKDHYEADFKSTNLRAWKVHDFGKAAGKSSDGTMNMSFKPGSFVIIYLQWSDLFGSSGNDYGFCLVDNSDRRYFCERGDIQDGDDDSFESILIFNDTNQKLSGNLALRYYQDPEEVPPRSVEMFFLTSGVTVKEYKVKSGSISGHAAVPAALAVGAISANDKGHDKIEPFSSRGPARIVFPAEEIRSKPDLVGIDRVATTGPGSFPRTFTGTSAAVAHIAGIAALLLDLMPDAAPEAQRSALVRSLLKQTAVDLGAAGEDKVYGAGRADALAAGTQLMADGDGDTVIDIVDNCPAHDNTPQEDFDSDGVGDACDDSDGDGMSDAFELGHPTILDPLDSLDGDDDPDGDGSPNLEEFLAMTDPENSSDFPTCTLSGTVVGLEAVGGGGTHLIQMRSSTLSSHHYFGVTDKDAIALVAARALRSQAPVTVENAVGLCPASGSARDIDEIARFEFD